MARASFFLRTVVRHIQRQPRSCPYCQAAGTELLGRKKVVLELRRCRECLLMFRHPKDEPEVSAHFYQGQYDEGFTTDLPDAPTLARWIGGSFAGTDKDLSEKIRIVRSLRPSGRLLDYGSSWGYGTFQFMKAGYDAVGYEIGTTRARFGRAHLGVEIIDTRAGLMALSAGTFDMIFTNHVLEHLCDPRSALMDISRLLKPEGVLVLFVPNGGGEQARRLGPTWGPMIGEKHVLAVDAAFLARCLPEHGLVPRFAASPYPENGLQLVADPSAVQLRGDELLAVATPRRVAALGAGRCAVSQG